MAEEKDITTNGEMKDEAIPVSSEMAIISIPEKGEISIEKEIQKLEKNVELFNRIKIVSLKLTKEPDWVFQSENSPYLMDRGAENIGIAWGIDVSGVQLRMEWAEDEKGRYYSFIATGKAYSKKLGRYVEDIGVCSQRDKLFGKIGDQWKPIEEVDMANIRRKAVTNLYNRLIKRCIGLMNVTSSDLIAAGLNIKLIPKIEYKTGAQKAATELSPEGKTTRQKLGNMLLMMANNDKAAASKLLEKYSFWKDDEGKEHKASSLEKISEKWINSIYGKVKKDYEKTAGGPPEERSPGEEG